MFCQKCGTQISDNVSFCGSCGNKIVQDQIKPEQDNLSPKGIDITVGMLKDAKKYCVEVENRIDIICDLEDKLEKYEEGLTKFSVPKAIATFVGGIVCLILTIRQFNKSYDDSIMKPLLNLLGGAGKIILIALTIVFFSMFSYYLYRALSGNRKEEQEIASMKAQIENVTQSVRLLGNGDEYEHSRIVYDALFPTKFVQSDEIDYLIDVFVTGRANNFKEALLLLDERNHRMKMESEIRRAKYWAQATALAAQQAASAAHSAASASYSTASAVNRLNQTINMQ